MRRPGLQGEQGVYVKWRGLTLLICTLLLYITPMDTAAEDTKDDGTGGVAPSQTVRRVSGFPDPGLLVELELWEFMPDVEDLRPLVDSRGENLRKQPAKLHKEIEDLQTRISGYSLDTMTDEERQRAGDALLALSLLLHLDALNQLEEWGRHFEGQTTLYHGGKLPEPPTRPRLARDRQVVFCRRILDELTDYSHLNEVAVLLGYHLHAAGRYHESNNLLLLNQDKGRDRTDRVNLLLGCNDFELGRRAEAGSTRRPIYFKRSAKHLEEVSPGSGFMQPEQLLFRLAWARYEGGPHKMARASLQKLWTLLDERMLAGKQQSLLREQVVAGLVSAYFCGAFDWQAAGLYAVGEWAADLPEEMDAGTPYEEEVYRLGLDLLWEHTEGSEAQTVSRLKAYWIVGFAYLERYSDRPDCPVVHDRALRALLELSRNPAVEDAQRLEYEMYLWDEREILIQLYGESGPWRNARKHNSHVLDEASRIVRKNLLELAELHHQRAQEVKDDVGSVAARPYYRRAKRDYKRLLGAQLDPPELLEVLQRLGEVCFFGLHDYDQAAVYYARCRDLAGKASPYRKECMLYAMGARAKAVRDADERGDLAGGKHIDLFDPSESGIIPELPSIDQDHPTRKLKIRPVSMPKVVKLWLAEARKTVSLDYEDKERTEYQLRLEFFMARVYLRYGDFGTARRRLNSILARSSDDKLVSAYIFLDLVRMCQYENDHECTEVVERRMEASMPDWDWDGIRYLRQVNAARLAPRTTRTAQDVPAEGGAAQDDSGQVHTFAGGVIQTMAGQEVSGLAPFSARLMVGPTEELPIEGLRISAQVDGFRARVLLDFHLSNPLDRRLEGTFQLCLPDGASPHFLAFGEDSHEDTEPTRRVLLEDWQAARAAAMDTDSIKGFRSRVAGGPKLARMVSRYKAAKAYLDTIYHRVDPALMEWAGGGVFSGRVYPIDPMTHYRIVVGYDMDLAAAVDDLELRFDLPAETPESKVDLHIRELPGVQVALTPAPQHRDVEGGLIHASFEGPDLRSFAVRLEGPGNVMVTGSEGKYLDYFAVRCRPGLGDTSQGRRGQTEGSDDDRGEQPWIPLSATVEGGEDILIQGRDMKFVPGQQLTIAGRGNPIAGATVHLTVQDGEQVRELQIPVAHKIDSHLAPRAYGELAVHELEAHGPSFEESALDYAKHFRITGRTCSLLMLESARDYRRCDIEPSDNERFHLVRPVADLLAEMLEPVIEVLMNGRQAFILWLEQMDQLSDIEIRLPLEVLQGLEEMPDASFQPEDPGQHEELAEHIARFERRPGDTALAREVVYRALSQDLGPYVYPMLRQLAGWRPHEPDLYNMMALSLAQGGSVDLAMLYYEVALNGDWNSPFERFDHAVLLDYLVHLRRIVRGEVTSSVRELASLRLEELEGWHWYDGGHGLIVTVTWATNGSDVDLLVLEPSGELCFQGHSPTGTGGVYEQDHRDGYGPEIYVARHPIPGKYQVALRQLPDESDHVGERTSAFVSIYRNWGMPDETVERHFLLLDKARGEVIPVTDIEIP